ncbi:helix-turn-helix domain-containing protein [Sphingomonas aracearum]|uniref:helix-turn-helix domain-containing protein n=1 Tax=Sphingomonas aracearum TaxID=2283317 RepID=UPI0023B3264B|nr:LysR family transcriptional regulator [Sphingomonas aracearum]
MQTLANLESFIRSAEAARWLSLTPAAVSRNVALLERNLGVRLFHRSTRRLRLTEAGDAHHGRVSTVSPALTPPRVRIPALSAHSQSMSPPVMHRSFKRALSSTHRGVVTEMIIKAIIAPPYSNRGCQK